jgi:hypothetical protein
MRVIRCCSGMASITVWRFQVLNTSKSSISNLEGMNFKLDCWLLRAESMSMSMLMSMMVVMLDMSKSRQTTSAVRTRFFYQ